MMLSPSFSVQTDVWVKVFRVGGKLKYIVCLIADFGENDMKSPTTVHTQRDEKGGYHFSLWS